MSPDQLPIPHDTNSLPSPNVKRDGDKVALYMAASLAEHASVSLTEGGMLLFALLVGGDYNQASRRLCTVPLLAYSFLPRLDYQAVALLLPMVW